jgi:para-aminobenzoate synthetase component I
MHTGWIAPLDALHAVIGAGYDNVALLYSGLKTGYSGRYSYLAFDCDRTITSDTIDAIVQCHATDDLPRWFGSITYEALGEDVSTHPAPLHAEKVHFCRYQSVIRFDHDTQTMIGNIAHLPAISASPTRKDYPAVASFHAPMSKDAYLEHVRDALAHIHAGNFYQVNLTRKYTGTFAETIDAEAAYAMFASLCSISPAPYSSFLWREGKAVLSSSPELFVQVDADRQITSRPIKGTASRDSLADDLQRSPKDRAENLMIVDLMRNDLSRCARVGTVEVKELFDVDSFATLHHLSSTITATLLPKITMPEILRATFPAGSMTGAPKRAAMQWIAKAEQLQRGIYSGAIGWINGAECDLCVVIRTLIVAGAQFEFQVGGGIVSDSEPEKEYQEILTKSRAMTTMLKTIMPQ